MHSLIIQISSEPIRKSEILKADDIQAGDMVSLDYAYDTDSNERKKIIRSLVSRTLPKGMFELNQDGETLTYKGGYAEWKNQYLNLIRTKTEALDTDNVMAWIGPAYQLRKAIVNPLDTDILFAIEFGEGYGVAEKSREFMYMLKDVDYGTQIYIGSILGYHF